MPARPTAPTIVTLFSDMTRMVTMQNLFHDGGFLLRVSHSLSLNKWKNNRHMNWLDIMGHIGSALSSITFMPQVYRVWKTRSAGDLSMANHPDRIRQHTDMACLWHRQKSFGR